MALTGKNNEEKIWNYLYSKIGNAYGVAGLMGNIYAESELVPNQVEILCLQRLKENGRNYTKESYTAEVDSGKISKAEFLNPLPNKQYGYSLCQWTSPNRKSGLYDQAKSRGVSIGDLENALDYLWIELNGLYKNVLNCIKSAKTVKEASDYVLKHFESPADVSTSVQNLRASYGQRYYDKYASAVVQKGGETVMAVTEKQAIQALINVAEGEIGYLEKASNAFLDDKTANAGSGNYTKYWRDVYPQFQGLAYCACFVSWCFMKAFGLETAKKLLKHWPYTYVPTIVSLFTRNANPKVGDIVAFYRSGEFTHTGIVIAVNGDQFTTIEGNTSGGSSIVPNGGGVHKKTYYNSNLPGTKFVSPDYSIVKKIESGSTPTSSPTTKPVATNDVPTLSSKVKSYAKTNKAVKVYRYAGTSYGLCSFSPLKKGSLVGICETLTGDDKKKWCFIKYGELYGFVLKSALNDIDFGVATGMDKSLAGTYVLKKKMNFRSSADNSSSDNVIGVIPKGTLIQNWGYYSKDSTGKKFLYVEYNGVAGFLRLHSSYIAKKK